MRIAVLVGMGAWLGACSEPKFTVSADMRDAATADAGQTGGQVAQCAADPYPCDILVQCTARLGAEAAACGACPTGFTGSGYEACVPALTGLGLSAGVLEPALSPEGQSYTFVTGMGVRASSFTPQVPGGATIKLDGKKVDSGKATDSIELLPYEHRTRMLHLSARNDEYRDISLKVVRTWLVAETLVASNADAGDWFGGALAASQKTLVVGAPGEASVVSGLPETNDNTGAGAVYVFESQDSLREQAILKGPYPDLYQDFGYSVDIEGDTIAVGAPGDGSNSQGMEGDASNREAPASGAVMIFKRKMGGFEQIAYLKSSNSGAQDRFGHSVALAGDLLIVGAPGESSASVSDPADDSALGAGAAYVFRREGDAFSEVAYLKAAHPTATSDFGSAVAASESLFAVGARSEDGGSRGVNGDESDLDSEDSGAVFVYRDRAGQIVRDGYLKAANADAGDGFGWSVDLAGSMLLVGAALEDGAGGGTTPDPTSNRVESSGAAYVFERQTDGWAQVAYLKSSRPRSGDAFGRRVVFCDSAAVVTSPGQGSSSQALPTLDDESAEGSGALFVFAPDTFRPAAILKGPTSLPATSLGFGVACADGLLFGGARDDSGEGGTLAGRGAVYTYR